MNKTVIGIDPGANGAISFTTTNDKIRKTNGVSPYKCHKLIGGRTIICNMAKTAYHKEIVAYIEKVHAMPNDGRSSLFKFGVNYGIWLGILYAKRIQTIEVSPQKWMRWWETKLGIKLPKEKKDRKNKLKEIASDYIDIDQKTTLWNADSILITMYGVYKEKEGMQGDR
tara:strand:- start:8163 stop:8669 length:507 start_codon:yes stop_codon:yes gene_type:complete